METYRPLFIVFEGIDGSGKSTQARRLANHLESLAVPVLLTFEPSDGPVGQKIRSLKTRLSPESEVEIFMEDRRHHVENVILPALASGKTVICDRYVHSSAAYQGSNGNTADKILERNFEFAPRPDLVFLIEIPVELAIDRISKGRNSNFSIFEKLENLRQVDSIYKSFSGNEIIRIDGTEDEESVSLKINAILDSFIKKRNPASKTS